MADSADPTADAVDRPTAGRPTADFAAMAEAMDAAVPAPDPERTLYAG